MTGITFVMNPTKKEVRTGFFKQKCIMGKFLCLFQAAEYKARIPHANFVPVVEQTGPEYLF